MGVGIRRDGRRYRVYVKVGSGPDALQHEKRFPLEASVKAMKAWQDEMRVTLRAKLRLRRGRHETLRADANRYLQLPDVKALISYTTRVAEINAWLEQHGDRRRIDLTRDDVLAERARWLREGFAPWTVNHRVRALKHLCHTFDGPHAPTPCDGVQKLPSPAAPRFVLPGVMKAVAPQIRDLKTRARYKVLTASGVRPSQLKRALPSDIDLRRRIWSVRAGKGGHTIPMYLDDDLLAAWQEFMAVNAWGDFDGSRYTKRLYRAGWPREWRQGKGRRVNLLRPYQAKHSLAITLAEQGVEWQDLADHFGHTDIATTKIYTGVVLARLKAVRARLAGRLGWQHKKRA